MSVYDGEVLVKEIEMLIKNIDEAEEVVVSANYIMKVTKLLGELMDRLESIMDKRIRMMKATKVHPSSI